MQVLVPLMKQLVKCHDSGPQDNRADTARRASVDQDDKELLVEEEITSPQVSCKNPCVLSSFTPFMRMREPCLGKQMLRLSIQASH